MANGIYNGPLNWMKAVIANCAKFQEVTGANDATEALAFIQDYDIEIPKNPTQGDIGWLAAVDYGPEREMVAVGGGAGTHFSHNGSLGVRFFRDTPSGTSNSWKVDLKNFVDIVDEIKIQMSRLSATDVDGLNYNIHRFSTRLGPNHNNKKESKFNYQDVIFEVFWGT